MTVYSRYVAAGFQLVLTPLMALIVAGAAFAVFNAVLGGDAAFKQVYAVVVHSGVVLSLQGLFGLPLAYARESLSSATNLAVFFPFLDENTFAARLLGSIDLFLIWWIVSLAIGLAVLYRRRTAPVATTMLVVYVAIGLVIAAIKTALSGA
jgi:Yip1 domain